MTRFEFEHQKWRNVEMLMVMENYRSVERMVLDDMILF